MPFSQVRDLQMYYELQGEGPRLLYVSGSGGDLRNHPNVFDGPLPPQFQVLCFDQRGLGQTAKPAGDYTMADYAEDAAALMDALGWSRCSLMGVSFGGMVAQELALRYPQRFDRVVMACTSSGGRGGASYPLHNLEDLSPAERAVFRIDVTDGRRDKAWQAANPETVQQLNDTEVKASAARVADPERGHGYHAQLIARAGHDTYDRLHSVRAPVLLCGGRYDNQAPPANMRVLNELIPGSRLEFFEGGHGFLSQDPLAYQRVIAFLQGKLDE